MGFNYFREKNKFMKSWIHTARQYREAGMDCAQINAIFELDWSVFKQERKEQHHKQYTTPTSRWDSDNEDKQGFRLQERSVHDQYFQDTYQYIDEALNSITPGAAQLLTQQDKTILVLIEKGLSQVEAALILGISQQAVSKHINKIKNILKKGL